MTTTTAEQAVRTHAMRILDPEHRVAVAEVAADAHRAFDAIHAGLLTAAPDGMRMSARMDSNLQLLAAILNEVVADLESGDLWMTDAEALRREAARIERLGAREQIICVTPEDWRLRRAEGFSAGVEALARQIEASDSALVDA